MTNYFIFLSQLPPNEKYSLVLNKIRNLKRVFTFVRTRKIAFSHFFFHKIIGKFSSFGILFPSKPTNLQKSGLLAKSELLQPYPKISILVWSFNLNRIWSDDFWSCRGLLFVVFPQKRPIHDLLEYFWIFTVAKKEIVSSIPFPDFKTFFLSRTLAD